jgi:hypothetical protein
MVNEKAPFAVWVAQVSVLFDGQNDPSLELKSGRTCRLYLQTPVPRWSLKTEAGRLAKGLGMWAASGIRFVQVDSPLGKLTVMECHLSDLTALVGELPPGVKKLETGSAWTQEASAKVFEKAREARLCAQGALCALTDFDDDPSASLADFISNCVAKEERSELAKAVKRTPKRKASKGEAAAKPTRAPKAL